MTGELHEMIRWQRSEEKRQDDDRCKRDIRRLASMLLNGGSGGPTDHLTVQQRLAGQRGAVLQRAAMLSRSGAHVIAFVIGAHWATDETRVEAERQQVEWKEGSDLSAGFLAVRTR